MRLVAVGILTSMLLAGCGLAGTGASAGAAGAEAGQARQGAQAEARVRERLDAAAQTAAERRRSGEAAAE